MASRRMRNKADGSNSDMQSSYGGSRYSTRSGYSARSGMSGKSKLSFGAGMSGIYEDDLESVTSRQVSGQLPDSKVGDFNCQWIKLLEEKTAQQKRNAAYVKQITELSPNLIPLVRWDLVPANRGGSLPAARQGHGLAVVTAPVHADKAVAQEVVYVIGGSDDMYLHTVVQEEKKIGLRAVAAQSNAEALKLGSRPASGSTVSTQATIRNSVAYINPSSSSSPPRSESPFSFASSGPRSGTTRHSVWHQDASLDRAESPLFSRPDSRLDNFSSPDIDSASSRPESRATVAILGINVLRKRADIGPTAFRMTGKTRADRIDDEQSGHRSRPHGSLHSNSLSNLVSRCDTAPRSQAHQREKSPGSKLYHGSTSEQLRTLSPARHPDAHQRSASPGKKQQAGVHQEIQSQCTLEWYMPKAELPRHVSSCTVCTLNEGKRIVVFGGVDYTLEYPSPTRELQVLEVATGEWRDLSDLENGPPACFEHAAGAASGAREMVVHGGRTSLDEDDAAEQPPLDTTYQLEVTDRNARWTRIEPTHLNTVDANDKSASSGSDEWCRAMLRAPARRAHTVVVHGGKYARAYLFGGVDDQQQVCGGAFVLDFNVGFWLAVETAGIAPAARAYHSASLLWPYMAVFGGIGVNGTAMRDLRMLHCPTMIWFAPKFSETLHEPSARAGHACIATALDVRPGCQSMIVFGGRGPSGESLTDVHKLVLMPPQKLADLRWAHSDDAFRYVSNELRTQIASMHTEFAGLMENVRLGQKDLVQDSRDVDTRGMSVHAQVRRQKEQLLEASATEEEVLAELREESEALEQLREASRYRLRELEIEADSLHARALRLATRVGCHQSLIERADVELLEPLSRGVPNPLCPAGSVERHSALWSSCTVSAEIILRSKDQSSASTSPPTSKSPTSPPGKPPVGDPRAAIRKAKIDMIAMVAQKAKVENDVFQRSSSPTNSEQFGDDWDAWRLAMRAEYRIVTFLKHPNLQEVYGAVFDLRGIMLLTEPFTQTLADEYSDAEGGKPTLSENDRLHLSSDLANALNYLHSQGVAHRHVVPENVFVNRSVGIQAKLAGHFASRVACRACGLPLVSGDDSGLPANLDSLARVEKNADLNLVDARPADIFSIGILFLSLWQQTWVSLATFSTAVRKRRDSRRPTLKAAHAKRLAVTATVADALSRALSFDVNLALEGVRDDTIRLVIMHCLVPDDSNRLPSALTLQTALDKLHKGDFERLPAVDAMHDLSRTAKLVDITADAD